MLASLARKIITAVFTIVLLCVFSGIWDVVVYRTVDTPLQGPVDQLSLWTKTTCVKHTGLYQSNSSCCKHVSFVDSFQPCLERPSGFIKHDRKRFLNKCSHASKSYQAYVVLLTHNFHLSKFTKLVFLSCIRDESKALLFKCRYIHLTVIRNLIRKLDFMTSINSLSNENHCQFLTQSCFIYFILSRVTYLLMLMPSNDMFIYKRTLPGRKHANTYHFSVACVGGGSLTLFSYNDIKPFISSDVVVMQDEFEFVAQVHYMHEIANEPLIRCKVPLDILAPKLPLSTLKNLCRSHGIYVSTRASKSAHVDACAQHKCPQCDLTTSLFRPYTKYNKFHTYRSKSNAKRKRSNINAQPDKKLRKKKANAAAYVKKKQRRAQFPPEQSYPTVVENIARGFCEDTNPNVFSEAGCAVCGKLTQCSQLSPLVALKCGLNIIHSIYPGMVVAERSSSDDAIVDVDGPVLDDDLKNVCSSCQSCLEKDILPKHALANGLWLGRIPEQLKGLRFAEKMLIARYRHNRCITIVKRSGMYKMRANAITYNNPIPKIYHRLPPTLEELDEVLAFIFTGPTNPTPEDFERCPMLVRRKKVTAALEWLKLNHKDYYDLEISYDILKTYPENGIPVVVDYRRTESLNEPEAMSVHMTDLDEGVDTGECSFVVHGLTGEQLYAKGEHPNVMRSIGMMHLRKKGKVLAIGHSEKPQSIYNNPQLFPQMFPWLFPYGLGGLGNAYIQKKISEVEHKRHLLMYHDKRFQMDQYFPFIAFNQEQIKDSTSGGFLLAEKKSFAQIADRILNLKTDVLETLARRLESGEVVHPETDDEKACYQLMLDLDHIGGKVDGSMTNKKYMRNQIWSLVSFKGAPSWYITLSPADVKHPICLYYADTQESFSPEIRDKDDRFRLISHNPVAGARFFHYMVQMFVKHVLGVGSDHPGIYGNTSAYYGTVEQQGRLTLHLHLLLWISNALTPQEIRQRIMDKDSEFQNKMVEYLEAAHVGEFLTGSHAQVLERQQVRFADEKYVDPTQSLPVSPPKKCSMAACKGCTSCHNNDAWWKEFRITVDDILLRANIHTCSGEKNDDSKLSSADKENKKTDSYGCKSNRWGTCKARFPRKLVQDTMVEPETGALLMKKHEKWLNTVTPILTYLFRCNTDVTSLLSGTAIKAVVAYVSDYITKSSLKTYMLFDAITAVFHRNSELIGGDIDRQEKARRLMTQVVNSLTSKLEIGAPMACMYLLGNPDHYTDSKFEVFYWKSFVREVRQAWNQDYDTSPDKMVIINKKGRIVGLSKVLDYMYRPTAFDDMALYDWIRLYHKQRRTPADFKKMIFQRHEAELSDEADSGDDELNIINQNEDNIEASFCKPLINNDNQSGSKTPILVNTDNMSENDVDHTSEYDTFSDEASADDLNIHFGETPVEKDAYWHLLKPKHPQSNTHMIHIRLESEEHIPDFVGGSLPRPNHGDREYYCSTMMTLFKPWRTGFDLKSIDDSWDDTFNQFNFNDRQLEVMKFFNLKYECLDARDDYAAQRKLDQERANREFLYPEHAMDDLDHNFAQNKATDEQYGEIVDDDILDTEGPQGKKAILSQQNMQDMENIISNAGWLDKSPDGLPEVGDITPLVPEIMQDGALWRKDVLDKKKQAIEEKRKYLPSIKVNEDRSSSKFTSFNEVKVVDAHYLDKTFKDKDLMSQEYIDTTVTDFNLNAEQERAFRIIANHATSRDNEQLKMYLGGMGGTGKSQVIKALIKFFKKRKESYRFVVLAPTGSAAALLSGWTYHSFLGINERMTDSLKSLELIRARLQGVEYIFFDEVSMVSCRDLYKISAQLSKTLNVHEIPFGGVNMIFAGDFAQLPPAMNAYSLYCGNVGTQVLSRMELSQQESAIGKALWHQICTVVILRQNMRQKTQSPEDAKFRKALENMRYKACTPEDISFLRSRVAGRGPNRPKLSSSRFRNESIITAWNSHKDKLNELGTIRFAQDTHQQLVSFYSEDTLNLQAFDRKKSKPVFLSERANLIYKANKITEKLHDELWHLPPHRTDHLPGILKLCIGLPIMIRHNNATELCITKGQEGTVAGWIPDKGSQGQRILNTLFVKLKNPPSTVQFDGLPENVVPITPSSQTAECMLSDDTILSIKRHQVIALPNFSMTDYASQGKTRPNNPVDLQNCQSHQSIYTCLSRSSTAAGTIIVQGFHDSKITGGCTGYLRQEFRELELLDEITKMKYEGRIPESAKVNGQIRNVLIRQFRQWKGISYIPPNIHQSISWSDKKPFELAPQIDDAKWDIINPKSIRKKSNSKPDIDHYSKFIKAKSSLADTSIASRKRKKPSIDQQSEDHPTKKMKTSVDSLISKLFSKPSKRKLDCIDISESSLTKKIKIVETDHKVNDAPLGIVWDNNDWSCAYDALFLIFHNIWSENVHEWSVIFQDMNQYMSMLSKGFSLHQHGGLTIEQVRDNVRHELNALDNTMFPNGRVGMRVADLAHIMLSTSLPVAQSNYRCGECGNASPGTRNLYSSFFEFQSSALNIRPSDNVAAILRRFLSKQSSRKCDECDEYVRREFWFDNIPKILVFHLPHTTVKINASMKIDGKVLKLRGIVYHGNYHYTARVISSSNTVWFHDGIETGNATLSQGLLNDMSTFELNKCRGKNIQLVVYSQD